MVERTAAVVRRLTLDPLAGLGRFAFFTLAATAWLFRDATNPRRWALLWPQIYDVGTRSMPVIIVTGGFIGMVLAVELYPQFAALGQESRLGSVVGISVITNIGPVLTAVMLSGRVGGAFSAELGTMAVTEQLDALRVMATDPISYLVVPRMLACIIMIPALTVFSDLVGVLGGWFIAVVTYGVNNDAFWSISQSFIGWLDIAVGLGKSLFFGIAIGLICCYKGFYCGRGARGVGRATTDAFVTSFVAIIILNFFLARFAQHLYHLIYGYRLIPIMG